MWGALQGSHQMSPKVDVTGVVDTHLISKMKEGIAALRQILDEWVQVQEMPEVDWSRLRAFEFQETLNLRNASAKQLEGFGCRLCSDFTSHVSGPILFYFAKSYS